MTHSMPGASSAISSPLVQVVLQEALEQAPQARIVLDDE
jgi:hypothetical protein